MARSTPEEDPPVRFEGNRLVEKERAGPQRPARVAPGLFAVALTVALTVALVVALSASSSASDGIPPEISGNAVVGGTLTSSGAGDSGIFKWQRCNPAATTCDPNAPFGSTSWPDIPGADEQSYVVAPDDAGFLIRVRAKGTSTGEQWLASQPVGPVPAPPVQPSAAPEPEHGVALVAEPVFGTVKVKQPGASGFSVLTGLRQIPVGSIIDTRGSRVELTAATGALGSHLPDKSVEFYSGLFRITQPSGVDAPATAKLVEKLACGPASESKAARASGAGPVAVAARRNRRKLWGSGSGGYRTSGRGSTGSVVGTTWLTKDTCGGTLTRVTEGAGVEVFDKKAKKNVFLGPGGKYFAEL
jgi:hypothetical protein